MAETGCLVGINFSPRQLKAIELFAAGTHNCTQVAKEVKVTRVTISKWRRNDQFMSAICNRAKVMLRESLPEIYKITKCEALKGKYQHIKILLDHIDNLDRNRSLAGTGRVSFTWEAPLGDSDPL